jgi:hypothetical protein
MYKSHFSLPTIFLENLIHHIVGAIFWIFLCLYIYVFFKSVLNLETLFMFYISKYNKNYYTLKISHKKINV